LLLLHRKPKITSDTMLLVSALRSPTAAGCRASLEEARAHVAAEDAAAFGQVRDLVRRYRSGEYVPEEQLGWALKTLENRAWREY
jgi:hypothetical protein